METGKIAVLGAVAALVGVGLVALASKPHGNLIEPRPRPNPDATTALDCLKAHLEAWRQIQSLPQEAASAGINRIEHLIKTIESVPVEHRYVVAAALRIAHGAYDRPAPSAEDCLPSWPANESLSLAYPRIPILWQARLVLGATPREITDNQLTPREAHEWLTYMNHRGDVEFEPPSWLLYHAAQTYRDPHNGDIGIGGQLLDVARAEIVTDIAVARWLIAAWRDQSKRLALRKHRVEIGAYGEEIAGSYLHRIDEIQAEDLRPSVRQTFERTMARARNRVEQEMVHQHEELAPIPDWWRQMPHATLLNTGADLILEGRVMQHCVATYMAPVRDLKSVIISIYVPSDRDNIRSTVELDRETLQVLQHRGVGNRAPPEICETVLAEYLQVWLSQSGEPGHRYVRR